MKSRVTDRSGRRHRVSLAEAAGVAHPQSQSWDLIRFHQVAEIVRLFDMTAAANLMNSTLIAIALFPTFGLSIVGWSALLYAATTVAFFHRKRRRKMLRPRPVSTRTIWAIAAQTAMIGILWMLLPLGFFEGATDTQRIVIIAVVVGMMAGATLVYSTIALAGACYFLFMGLGGFWMAYCIESWTIAAMTVLYTSCLGYGMVSNGRSFVQAALTRAELSDQKANISLLLRETEEAEGEWLWQLDAELRISHASSRMTRRLGIPQSELIGVPMADRLEAYARDGKHRGAHAKLAATLRRREAFSDFVIAFELAGEQRWFMFSAVPFKDESGEFAGYRGVGSDITELNRAQAQVAHMAQYDALTGLPNRAMIHEAIGATLRRSARRGTRPALVLFDLDRFKLVNDSLGHPVGDQLLCMVADRVRDVIGSGHLFGRIGGDEFALVTADHGDRESVATVTEAIIAAVSEPYEIDGHRLGVGITAGIAFFNEDGTAADVLVRNADLALYHAKERGRGIISYFEPVMHERAEERRQIEFELRLALKRDELELVYQPIVSADGSAVRGFEALLRWNHPVLGEISPTRFIPVAEETGVIGSIGEWVLRTACQEATNWPESTKLSVNLSPIQFTNPGLPGIVMSALATSQLRPERLELEITEGVFLTETALTTKILKQLKALGVSIALDDFGTGYSSLGYLQKTSFSTLKIDRMFIHGLSTGKTENTAIVKAIVAMANSLSIATTAEGAESEDDLEAVRRMGCTQVQGFVVGKPMTSDEAQSFLGLGEQRAVA